jgi:hypothetical protein
MIVDCMTCPVRDQRCQDCAFTALRAAGPAQYRASAGSAFSTDPEPCTGLALDAAESRVVSLFVGAGLVNAAEVGRLRAQAEAISGWGAVRYAG